MLRPEAVTATALWTMTAWAHEARLGATGPGRILQLEGEANFSLSSHEAHPKKLIGRMGSFSKS